MTAHAVDQQTFSDARLRSSSVAVVMAAVTQPPEEPKAHILSDPQCSYSSSLSRSEDIPNVSEQRPQYPQRNSFNITMAEYTHEVDSEAHVLAFKRCRSKADNLPKHFNVESEEKPEEYINAQQARLATKHQARNLCSTQETSRVDV